MGTANRILAEDSSCTWGSYFQLADSNGGEEASRPSKQLVESTLWWCEVLTSVQNSVYYMRLTKGSAHGWSQPGALGGGVREFEVRILKDHEPACRHGERVFHYLQ